MSEQHITEHDVFLDNPKHRAIIEAIYLGLMVDDNRSTEDVMNCLRETQIVNELPEYQRGVVVLLAANRAEKMVKEVRLMNGAL